MGLETGTYIQDLVTTNPAGGDLRSVGDDHLRLIKTTLRNTFPNAAKPQYFPTVGVPTAEFAVLSSEMDKTFFVVADGTFSATLPVLGVADAGWQCHFVNFGSGPFWIYPPSGTLQSGEIAGLDYCRRQIPGMRCTALWSGGSYFVSRVPSVPIGTELEYIGATLPSGYEWPNGQTLDISDYLEYSLVAGSGLTPDSRGRVAAGQDNMGGVSANRLQVTMDGDVAWNTGGEEAMQLSTSHLPPYIPAGDATDFAAQSGLALNSGATSQMGVVTGGLNAGSQQFYVPGTGAALSVSGSVNVAAQGIGFTGTAQGGTNAAIGLLQPTIIKKKILVVE